jgi:hypothetical protein
MFKWLENWQQYWESDKAYNHTAIAFAVVGGVAGLIVGYASIGMGAAIAGAAVGAILGALSSGLVIWIVGEPPGYFLAVTVFLSIIGLLAALWDV